MSVGTARGVLFVALAVIAAIVAACLLASGPVERALLFPAPQPRPIDAAMALRFACRDGATVFALHRAAPDGAPTVVQFHGNGEQLADQTELIDALARRGLGVLAVEYPGYGPAHAQRSSERAILDAARCALDHARGELALAPERVVLMGSSLGTGVAARMALEGRGARLVLVSPYTSIPDVAHAIAPWLPIGPLLPERFETARFAARVALPVLIAHGDRDPLIPVAMGRALARTFPHATFREVTGAQHNDVWDVGGEPLLDAIAAFALTARASPADR